MSRHVNMFNDLVNSTNKSEFGFFKVTWLQIMLCTPHKS